MGDPATPTPFEDVKRPDNVDIEGATRIDLRSTRQDCREMDDQSGMSSIEELPGCRALGDVEHPTLDLRWRSRAVGKGAIGRDYRVARLRESLGQAAANEPGRPGDQHD
jgi:hypothetical protein